MGGEVVNGMVNAVAQPMLAKVVDDNERQLHVFRKMVRFTAFVSFPLMLGLSLVSRELIIIVITEKWLASAGMLQILAVWGAFMPVQSMLTNLLVSRGRSQVFMWCTIVQGLLTLGILLAVHPYGISPMLVVYCVFNALWLFVWHYFVKKEIPITLPMFLRDILPYAVVALGVMLLTYFSTTFIENIYLLFTAKVFLAALLYITVAGILRSEELHEIICFLFKRKEKGA